MSPHKFPLLEDGLTHLEPQRLRLVRPCYHTTVIIREYSHGLILQVWSEYPLTGGVEIIAVYKGYHATLLKDHMTLPQT